MAFRQKRNILLLALAACVVFPVFFTETMTVVELDHECAAKEGNCRKTPTEEEICQPCLRIEAAMHFLKNLKPALVVVSSAMPLLVSAHTPEHYSYVHFYFLSPVELKVRFNT